MGNELAHSPQEVPSQPESVQGKWQQCLTLMREKVTHQAYQTWLLPIIPVNFVDNQLMLRVPSQFFYEWIESNFYEILHSAVKKVFGLHAKIEYLIASRPESQPEAINLQSDTSNEKATPPENASPVPASPEPVNLDARYSFANFYVHNDNELVLRAAQEVARHPGHTDFNPLFIYGRSGCGKTHLLNAVGNAVLERNKRKKVRYYSSEVFVNEYIYALQSKKIEKFNQQFLKYEVVLFDDIHFLTGKNKSQEGLYFLLSEMERRRKQIVISSSLPPSQLKGFKKRLISFFKRGLIVDLVPPSYETRIRWMDEYCRKNNLQLLPEVKELLARSLVDGLHQTRAVMVRIAAQSSLLGEPVSLATTRRILEQIDSAWLEKNGHFPFQKSIKIEDIIKAVSEYLDVPEDLIIGFSRQREVSYARQIAIYLCKELTHLPFQSIGYYFKDRHYTAILYNYRKIANQIHQNHMLAGMIAEIKSRLYFD